MGKPMQAMWVWVRSIMFTSLNLRNHDARDRENGLVVSQHFQATGQWLKGAINFIAS